MTVILKLIYRFYKILIKILAGFFAEISKLILKFIWKLKGSRVANFEKEEQNGRTHTP